MSHLTPKRQAWLQTGPPTYSPPCKEDESKDGKKAKSCEDDSESGDEYTLTSYGDISFEDPYVPLGSKRYNLRPKVSRPPLPRRRSNVVKDYESSYSLALAEHLRNSYNDDAPPSPTSDFKVFMDSVRSSRMKAMKQLGSVSSRRGSSSSRLGSTSSESSPSSRRSSGSFDARDCGSPVRPSRVHRRPPIPTWD